MYIMDSSFLFLWNFYVYKCIFVVIFFSLAHFLMFVWFGLFCFLLAYFVFVLNCIILLLFFSCLVVF